MQPVQNRLSESYQNFTHPNEADLLTAEGIETYLISFQNLENIPILEEHDLLKKQIQINAIQIPLLKHEIYTKEVKHKKDYEVNQLIIDNLLNKNNEIKKERENLKNKFNSAVRDVSTFKNRKETYKNRFTESKQQNQKLEEEINLVEFKNNELRADNQNLKRNYERMQSEYSNKESECSQLEKRLKTSDQKAEEAEKRIRELEIQCANLFEKNKQLSDLNNDYLIKQSNEIEKNKKIQEQLILLNGIVNSTVKLLD